MPLRHLLRDPIKVKRLTRAGKKIEITDNGKPLWVIHPAPAQEDEAARARAIDEVLEEAVKSSKSPVSAAALLEDSRR